MSTYEARGAGSARRELAHDETGTLSVSPERIERTMMRARQERSRAMWVMLQAVFGRPEARDAGKRQPLSQNEGRL